MKDVSAKELINQTEATNRLLELQSNDTKAIQADVRTENMMSPIKGRDEVGRRLLHCRSIEIPRLRKRGSLNTIRYLFKNENINEAGG